MTLLILAQPPGERRRLTAPSLAAVSVRELDAAGISDPDLRASYEVCRRLNARHGKTYYLATLLLPAWKRPYVHALYGFARYADEIVDDVSSTLTAHEKADRLGAWGDAFLAANSPTWTLNSSSPIAGGTLSGRFSRSSAGTMANNSSSEATPIASSMACRSFGVLTM